MSTIEQKLHDHAKVFKNNEVTLKTLLFDEKRSDSLIREHVGLTIDFSRQLVTDDTLQLLLQLAEETQLKSKIEAMFAGEHINATENRAVLHTALRARYTLDGTTHSSSILDDQITNLPEEFFENGNDVLPLIQDVNARIESFSNSIRNHSLRGATGKVFKTILCVGIGGSFLGAKFVYEALRSNETGGIKQATEGLNLRFLANIDPVDVDRALEGVDPETTLVIICSKTFTTTETMINANTIKQWILRQSCFESLPSSEVTSHHIIACSTATDLCQRFGILSDNVFPFWDWVGGRYSVTSSVGLLPLAIYFGWDNVKQFLAGARDMDVHFKHTPLSQNLPVLMGLIGIWNSQYLGFPARALACYSQALCDFADHIQQVDMESNGKRVTLDGVQHETPFGEIDFGQAGTNSQHSFFQLFHQGRVVPVDFIGMLHSQVTHNGHSPPLNNHDELMCNFFAQPDALALGTTDASLNVHRIMPGNRPSSVILFDRLSPYEVGLLLSLYEHRTAVQGFVWNLNSFDQFGVELGKTLANNIRSIMSSHKTDSTDLETSSDFVNLNPSTKRLLSKYLNKDTSI